MQGERRAGTNGDGAAGADCGSVLQIEHPCIDGRRARIGIGTQEEERPRPGLRQAARPAAADRAGEDDLVVIGVECRTAGIESQGLTRSVKGTAELDAAAGEIDRRGGSRD